MTDETVTAASRDAAGIDAERLTAWLSEHLGLRAPLRFRRIGGGQSNLTFRIDDAAGRAVALRRPPLGEVLQTAHDMGREHHVQKHLSQVGMPVPRQLALCEDPGVTGAPFYVMELVEGLILTSVALAESQRPEIRRASALSLATTLALLQSVDLDAAGLGDMRRPRAYADRQLRRWQGQWEASRTRDLPLVDDLTRRLTDAMPQEREAVLVHGDYRLDNVILGPDGAVIAVLDWELCTVGHPLADVGLMLAYWQEARDPGGLFDEIAAREGFPTSDELARAYGEAAGRDLGHLDWFVAFAYWKMAIIAEGVYRRWLNDPANGAESAAQVGAMVPRIVSQADEAARRAGI